MRGSAGWLMPISEFQVPNYLPALPSIYFVCGLSSSLAGMGLGSDIVARFHTPLAAAAAVMGAAAASSADLRIEKLQSRAVNPIVPYATHHASEPSTFAGGSAVMEMRLQQVFTTASSGFSGSCLASSCAASSQRLYGAPSMCFYVGANHLVPICFLGSQTSRFADASRLEHRANFASSLLMPPSVSQIYGFRNFSYHHTMSDARPQLEGATALISQVNQSLSVLYPATPCASSFPGSDVSTSGVQTSFGHVSASRYLSSLLRSVVEGHHSAGVLSSFFTRASLHTWKSASTGTLDIVFASDAGARDKKNPALTVVLLGWLGSHQKQLRKYAEWYTDRGINAVTFVIPFKDILLYRPGGRAEEHVEKLALHLVSWLNDKEDGQDGVGVEKQLLFHTFSNTGWLTYGFVLEKLLSLDERLLGKIKGCVVDSAPAAKPDPQVWANGFSAALLAKKSVAVRKGEFKVTDGTTKGGSISLPEPHVAEAALLAFLEKFFKFFFMIPPIRDRLSEVTTLLTERQPPCPQLYIYSTADRVIPHTLVESFAEQQRREGHVVRAINMQLSPHVDHFRTYPDLYGKQLQSFLQDCIGKTCEQ